MRSAASPESPLTISESAPARITIARLGDPASVMAARKPSPIDSTATNVMTTPAMPMTATAEELRRWGIVRTLSAETVSVWEIHRSMSDPPERVGDAQAHRADGGQRARDAAEGATQRQPDEHVAGPHHEHRQERVVEAPAADGRVRHRK